jgi:myo-inositol-1(or 4)-monophosphatase
MDDYLAFAKDLARQGGQLIQDNFEGDLNIEVKRDVGSVHDNSLVTQVDKNINDLVIQSIRQAYPEHGVMGEEGDIGTGEEEFQWLCDPLDGTKAFTLGIPVTTFILGLVKSGEVQLAVVYYPFTDKLYHAIRGQGSYCNDQPVQVNKQSLSGGGCVMVYESYGQFEPAITALGGQLEPVGGAGFRAVRLASGFGVGIIQNPGYTDFHDVGPASLIVEEAGGRVTDLAGNKLRFDRQITNGIILSNGAVHHDLIKVSSRQDETEV